MDNNYIQSELPLPVHNHFEVLPDDLFIPPNALEVCLESFSGPVSYTHLTLPTTTIV